MNTVNERAVGLTGEALGVGLRNIAYLKASSVSVHFIIL